jgi:hypothetical protein
MGTLRHSCRRARSRHPERGAALFVVVMVITLLSAVGLFAIRSASLVDIAAGYNRQAVQAHYLTEYGTIVAVTELGSGAGAAYVRQMEQGTDDCRMTRGLPPLAPGAKTPCYKVFMSELARRVDQQFPGNLLLEPALEGTPPVPGSLGPYSPSTGAALEGNFVVELTDPGPADRPVAGTDVGGTGQDFRFVQVVLTTFGQVRPQTATTACAPGNVTTASLQAVRAHVVLGPIPR